MATGTGAPTCTEVPHKRGGAQRSSDRTAGLRDRTLAIVRDSERQLSHQKNSPPPAPNTRRKAQSGRTWTWSSTSEGLLARASPPTHRNSSLSEPLTALRPLNRRAALNVGSENGRNAQNSDCGGPFGSHSFYSRCRPVSVRQVPDGLSTGHVQVHGNHRSCERGGRGWHRHNRYGERRECREWRGQGRRPDSCVRAGPVWICDY